MKRTKCKQLSILLFLFYIAAILSPMEVSLAYEDDSKANIKVTKILKQSTENNGGYGEEFNYQLKAISGPNNRETNIPMPKGASGRSKNDIYEFTIGGFTSIDHLINSANIYIDFSEATVGIYEYQIIEIPGSREGMIYSQEVYKIEVQIKNTIGRPGVQLGHIAIYEVRGKSGKTNDNPKKLNLNGEISFTNDYITGNLKLEKIVKGSRKDKEKEFEFILQIDEVPKGRDDYEIVKTKQDYTRENTVIKAGERTRFVLKDRETIDILNIPMNTNYMIEEKDYSDRGFTTHYIHTINGETTKVSSIGDIRLNNFIERGNNKVEFINEDINKVRTGLEMDTLIFLKLMALGIAGLLSFYIIRFTHRKPDKRI